MTENYGHDPKTCSYCQDLQRLMDMDKYVPVLGTDLFICIDCFVRYPKGTNHDRFIAANPPNLNPLWDTQNPEFTPFDDRRWTIGLDIKLARFLDSHR